MFNRSMVDIPSGTVVPDSASIHWRTAGHKLRFDAGTQCNPPLAATRSMDIQWASWDISPTGVDVWSPRLPLPSFAARPRQQCLPVGGESPEAARGSGISSCEANRGCSGLVAPPVASRHVESRTFWKTCGLFAVHRARAPLSGRIAIRRSRRARFPSLSQPPSFPVPCSLGASLPGFPVSPREARKGVRHQDIRMGRGSAFAPSEEVDI